MKREPFTFVSDVERLRIDLKVSSHIQTVCLSLDLGYELDLTEDALNFKAFLK